LDVREQIVNDRIYGSADGHEHHNRTGQAEQTDEVIDFRNKPVQKMMNTNLEIETRLIEPLKRNMARPAQRLLRRCPEQ
jgi:hypothetical protein